MREDKLPAGWVWATLGEIAISVSTANEVDTEGEFVYIDIGSIDNTVFEITEPKIYTWANAPSRARQIVKTGDILFSTVRTYLKNIAQVPAEFDNQVASTGFCVIRPVENLIDHRFVFFYILSNQFLEPLNTLQIGAVYPTVKDKDVFNQPFPLPPLADQIRIAKLLDSLMEQVRAAQAALAEVPGLLRQFRQKVLALGMRGELTREWRENHPEMSELEFLSELKDQTNDKKKLFFREKVVDPQPFELPISWEWTHFGIVANISANLVDPKNYPQLPLIAPDNIQKETGRLLDFQTVEEVKPISAKHKFSAGQILYSKIRPALSKVIIAEFEGICSADIYPIDSKIETGFLFSFMRSRPFLDSILSSSSRTVLPKVNQDELNLVPVPLPPLEEQKQITKQIEKFLFLADQLESDYEAAKSQLDALPQSLLSKAFRGELCTPEPGAESAEILLARIQKEKARLEILEKQQRSQRQARKMKSEKKSDLKALATVLETSKGEWILARMAWQQSEHRDDIEGFYAELKRLIETEQMVEEEKRGKESYLRMTQA